MNKSGFTLVELLAIIIILLLLMTITGLSITKVVGDAKNDLSDLQMKLVKSAAQTWGAENIDKLPNKNECAYITIANLQDYGLLDRKLSNSKNSKPIDNSIKIKISNRTTEQGTKMIEYEINPKNVNGCLNAITCALISGKPYTVGAKYSCDFGGGARNFYILELGTNPVTNSTLKKDEVALILEGNYDNTTQTFCDQLGPNPKNGKLCNADGLNEKIEEIAGTWTRLEKSQIVLPSVAQILVADGKSEDEYIKFPTLTNAWLYNWPDNADYGNKGTYAYWTSWASTYTEDDTYYAWFVDSLGGIFYNYVAFDEIGSVRPVVNLKF